MRNAITVFSIFKRVNLDLKSLWPRAYGLELRTVIFCRTLPNDQRP